MYIYGRNTVEEALRDPSTTIEKLFLRESINKKNLGPILELASSQRIPVGYVPGRKLHELVGQVQDQGIVALIADIDYLDLDQWLEKTVPLQNPALLMVDGVEDPHNLGAIIRSAAASGISGVFLPKHGSSPVTPAVHKTAAGNVGKIPIVRGGNMNQAILELKNRDFWIAGLDMEGDNYFWQQAMDMPLVIIIGGENKGLRPSTRKHCDFIVSIPLSNQVESLNASVAASLVCFEWKRQQWNTQK